MVAAGVAWWLVSRIESPAEVAARTRPPEPSPILVPIEQRVLSSEIITRGTGRAEITRAVVESMAYQVRDVIDAMVAASGTPIVDLRVDGGASVMDLLCQFQADQLGVTVQRPVDQETTALGAAFLAGLAEGVWASTDDIAAAWTLEAEFDPAADRTTADALHTQWLRAVERSRAWES